MQTMLIDSFTSELGGASRQRTGCVVEVAAPSLEHQLAPFPKVFEAGMQVGIAENVPAAKLTRYFPVLTKVILEIPEVLEDSAHVPEEQIVEPIDARSNRSCPLLPDVIWLKI